MTNDLNLFNLFAYLKNGEIRRIPLNRDLQKKLTQMYRGCIEKFLPENDDKILRFEENVGWKPEENEIFVIDNFELPTNIIEAVKNPLSVCAISEEEYESIKAIFCGTCINDEKIEIAFTTFDTRKIIKKEKKFMIFYSDDTFTEFEKKALVLDERVDAIFKQEKLYFRSFHNAKRIFGDVLNKYYREATDEEIKEFGEKLFGDEIPNEYVDYISRKLIFGISKSGDIYDIKRLIEVSKEFGLHLEINENNGKLVLPQDKKTFKRLLKLLNDDLLESPLTEAKYETNSKRRIL